MRIAIMAACAGALAACSWPQSPVAPAPFPAQQAGAPSLQALAGEGRYADAIALLEAAARRHPSAALLGNLGYAYYLDGRAQPALAALERACLLEPGNPVPWERLAAMLEANGESGRAIDAMRHARTLREAGIKPEPRPESGHDKPAAPSDDLWPADMARVEVRQVGAGMVEVARVEGAAAPAQRLEVSNGNGVRGMAAAVARQLRAQGMQVVRLTNTIPFNVEHTRVEVRGKGEPQLRIVLGRDMAQARPEIKKPPAVSRRQAP